MSVTVAYRWYDSGEPHDSTETFTDDETWIYGFHAHDAGHVVVSRVEKESTKRGFPNAETVKVYGSGGFLSVRGQEFGPDKGISWLALNKAGTPFSRTQEDPWATPNPEDG